MIGIDHTDIFSNIGGLVNYLISRHTDCEREALDARCNCIRQPVLERIVDVDDVLDLRLIVGDVKVGGHVIVDLIVDVGRIDDLFADLADHVLVDRAQLVHLGLDDLFDLLTSDRPETFELEWISRSTIFETLETGKLGEEIFSPSYVQYFNSLPLETRQEAVTKFARSQNGISPETLQAIYEHLYDLPQDDAKRINIRANLEVNQITREQDFTISMRHTELHDERTSKTGAVVAATGFVPSLPRFVNRLDIEFEGEQAWKVDANYRIHRTVKANHHLYATTNLELSHGPAADNLGMSVSRNQLILNDVAGKELYPVEQHATFTTFN